MKRYRVTITYELEADIWADTKAEAVAQAQRDLPSFMHYGDNGPSAERACIDAVETE